MRQELLSLDQLMCENESGFIDSQSRVRAGEGGCPPLFGWY